MQSHYIHIDAEPLFISLESATSKSLFFESQHSPGPFPQEQCAGTLLLGGAAGAARSFYSSRFPGVGDGLSCV